MGDNPTENGNDWDGFVAAGFQRSICVPHPTNAPLVPPELKGRSFVGNDFATKLVFEAINEEVKEMKAQNQMLTFSPDEVSHIINRVQRRVEIA